MTSPKANGSIVFVAPLVAESKLCLKQLIIGAQVRSQPGVRTIFTLMSNALCWYAWWKYGGSSKSRTVRCASHRKSGNFLLSLCEMVYADLVL